MPQIIKVFIEIIKIQFCSYQSGVHEEEGETGGGYAHFPTMKINVDRLYFSNQVSLKLYLNYQKN